MIKQGIIDYCKSIGLDTVGFIKCRKFDELKSFYENRKILKLQNEFEEDDIEKRINPNIYMSEGKTIISIAFPYLWCSESVDNGFSIYTRGLDYHRVVKSYLDKVCNYIIDNGGKAISFVDSNSLPERYIAYLAGVGSIGKNNMIITKKYGSYVFLGEIITDIDIECSEINDYKEIELYKECKTCDLCIRKCPTKSIQHERKNPNICSSYITQKKELGHNEVKLLKGRVFGCDICQSICPHNKELEFTSIVEFKPLTFMEADNTENIANMNNKYFKENIMKTSCGWRGKNIIKRNAIIRLHNEGKNIEAYYGDSPFINEWINKLLDRNGE